MKEKHGQVTKIGVSLHKTFSKSFLLSAWCMINLQVFHVH